ncbi:hypothetical protein [Rubinisphaera italica]|uniref:hypothetical protein n=1 Tax=Rubinisphaera italica TaxID=2527969 RepID=UPI0011B5DAA4|nr:hypothetical protein [Rubinisphaera italica]
MMNSLCRGRLVFNGQYEGRNQRLYTLYRLQSLVVSSKEQRRNSHCRDDWQKLRNQKIRKNR